MRIAPTRPTGGIRREARRHPVLLLRDVDQGEDDRDEAEEADEQ